jgi:deoxyribodipyrimidine photo-lyase
LCFDERLLHGRHASASRTQFLIESLAGRSRSRAPQARKSPGGAARQAGAGAGCLAAETRAERVHFSADAGPFARGRDDRLRRAFGAAGTEAQAHPGLFIADDLAAIRTSGDTPYTVFTPLYRNWSGLARRRVRAAPRSLPTLPPGLEAGEVPRLSDLGLSQEVEDPIPGGERAGRERMNRFLAHGVTNYAQRRDMIGEDGSSRLSAYLHLGCISPRELEQRLPSGEGAAAFRRQLAWRDFYAHVLLHFPANARSEYQECYRGSLRWSRAVRRYEAWQEGRTGYPLVDAAMRQLRREAGSTTAPSSSPARS